MNKNIDTIFSEMRTYFDKTGTIHCWDLYRLMEANGDRSILLWLMEFTRNLINEQNIELPDCVQNSLNDFSSFLYLDHLSKEQLYDKAEKILYCSCRYKTPGKISDYNDVTTKLFFYHRALGGLYSNTYAHLHGGAFDIWLSVLSDLCHTENIDVFLQRLKKHLQNLDLPQTVPPYDLSDTPTKQNRVPHNIFRSVNGGETPKDVDAVMSNMCAYFNENDFIFCEDLYQFLKVRGNRFVLFWLIDFTLEFFDSHGDNVPFCVRRRLSDFSSFSNLEQISKEELHERAERVWYCLCRYKDPKAFYYHRALAQLYGDVYAYLYGERFNGRALDCVLGCLCGTEEMDVFLVRLEKHLKNHIANENQ